MNYYLIIIRGGTEIESLGPFSTSEARDKAILQADFDDRCDNAFRASCPGQLNLGVFIDGELNELRGYG